MEMPTEKKDVEIWLRSLGCNISDTAMKNLLLKIEKNPTLLYYFTVLKEHVKPKDEANRIHKFYLYHTLKNGGFGVDIPSHFTVTSHQDLKLTQCYLRSTYKKQALETVKIPEATAKLEKAQKILSLKKNSVRLLTQKLIKNPAHDLVPLKQKLISAKEEIKIKQKCIKALLNPEDGSHEFQSFVSARERKENIIQMIASLSIDSDDDNNLKVNTNDKLSLSNILEKMIECSPKRYLTTINNYYINKSTQVNNNSTLTGEKMINYLEKYKYLFSLVKSLKFSSMRLSRNLQDYSMKKKDALSKIDKIRDEVGLIFQIKLFENVDEAKKETRVLTYPQYSVIENILNTWGESLKSPTASLTECFNRKHADYEYYQSIHEIVSSIPDSSLAYSDNRKNLVNSMMKRSEELSEHFTKIQSLIKTNDDVSDEIIKLLNQMPFFKVQGKPITEIIEEIKCAICDLELSLTFPV